MIEASDDPSHPAAVATTLNDGYLGLVIDEGRSEVRKVSRLADSRELTNL